MAAVAERYDVAVVGAGPAGAMAALTAARAGRSVILIEKAKFPRAKVCGCCVSGAAAALLRKAGVADVLREGLELDRFALAAGGHRATLPLYGSVALSRAALDAALVRRACEAGVTFADGVAARLGELEETGRWVELKASGRAVDGRSVARSGRPWRHGSTRLKVGTVVVADGVGGRLLAEEPAFGVDVARATRVGIAAIVDDGGGGLCGRAEVGMAVARSGYVGMVRLEDGRVNVATALDASALRQGGGPGRLAERIVREAGLERDAARLLTADWRGTAGLTRRRRRLAGRRVIVAGDAAGYVEPFTGEGIAWALASGAAAGAMAVDIAAAGDAWAARPQWCEREWERRWGSMLGWPQRRCRIVAAILRRPAAVAGGVRLLRRVPWLADAVTQRIAGPLKGAVA